jgi:predicted helicase
VLDWSADALNRVDREAFFQRFEAEDSVQYFYEPFLEAFDPELRKQLGVWYTPKEIVRYQVARVDWALRHELGLDDGLADPKVVVLDPCCGTGAYLVEVLRVIAGHWREQGGGALAGHELKRAALTRLFGFELLPAPYVVAHLQLGLLLHRLKVPLKTLADGSDERVGVYLTNALTGWEPPKEPKNLVLPFPEFAAEREAANHVKRTEKILVILGNPPYNGYAGVAMDEERGLSAAYRKAEQGPKPQGQGLNDLYVRFFRMAERQIAECTGQGVVCYISNYSWLDGLSHTAMREQFLHVFDRVWIDNLQGDKYRTGKLTPEGEPDPSAFSTDHNKEGIQVGTAIATLVRRGPHAGLADIGMREWWGRSKREALLEAIGRLDTLDYPALRPQSELGWALCLRRTAVGYLQWPKLPDLFPVSYPGIKTSRDAVLVDIDRDVLEKRMRRYFEPKLSDAEITAEIPELMESTARFNATATRRILLNKGFDSGRMVRYCYRPFDNRWLYWHPETKLLDEKRLDYMSQIFEENVWLFTTGQTRKGIPEPAYLTSLPADLNLQDSGARGIPLLIRESFQDLLGDHSADRPNLSQFALDYLAGLSHPGPAPTKANTAPRDNIASSDIIPEDLFFHALAVLHSPAYRDANGGALRQDWPRIPLPRHAEVLQSSANWGRAVAALLDTETSVPGVTVFSGTGAHPPAHSTNGAGVAKQALPVTASLNSSVLSAALGLNTLAVFSRSDGEGAEEVDFELTAGWGHGGKEGVTMPGRGRVESRLAEPGEVDPQWGEKTLDVYLNGRAYWKNIPQPVWEYTLGGYQVLKKWLSYREKSLLGRALKLEEVKEFAAIARRIAALQRLRKSLDANYSAVIRQTCDQVES